MSLFDYKAAIRLHRADEPFYALIMAAMYRGDDVNVRKLRDAWPDVWDELQARYRGAGARIPGDPDYDDVQRDRAALGMPPT